MDFVREPKAIQEFWDDCKLTGENVVDRTKLVKECTGIYKNEDGLKEHGDNLAYWVSNQNFNRENPILGNLQWGITYINPFTVGGECAMTRGHFHRTTECDEYYYGLKGDGFLLYWDGEDDFFAEKIYEGSLHYINGIYAHRIINSGDEVLAVAACSLPSTVQDHDAILETGFPYRCFKENGKIKWIKED